MKKTQTVAPGIQKLGEQHYRVWWTEDGTGRRRSRVVRGPLKDAKNLRAAMVDAQTRGVYVAPQEQTLRHYSDTWLEQHETMGETRKTTHERYRSLLAAVCDRLGSIPLQELTKADIEGYYVWALRNETTRRSGGKSLVSGDTVNKRHKILKRLLDDAVEDNILTHNPAARANHPSPARPHGQAFTREEAQIVLAAVYDSWVDLPVRIALYTGLRLGEVMALRWRHVDLPADDGARARLTVAATISETKGGYSIQPYGKSSHSRATIAIGPELAETLKAHRKAQAARRLELGPAWEDNDLVVCGEWGQVLRPSKVSARFTPIIRVMEEDGTLSTAGATFHTLRHTHATLLLRDGVPVHVVSRRLRHSKSQITLDYYSHVIPSDDEAVADGFDGTLGAPYENRTMHISCTQKAASGVEAASQ